MDQATVFAAPLRFGAGIQNKVLEALAMEVPVVATPLAADGLRTEDGGQPPVQVTSDTQQFAALISKRLAEHASDSEPVAEARRFVERHFVWRSSGQKLDQVFNRVVDVVKH
jgi:glycosyltransferase involved in cell wall biosynthesis